MAINITKKDDVEVIDLDNLAMDQVSDLLEYINPPTGVITFTIPKVEVKARDDGSQYIRFTCQLTSAEPANADDPEVPIGSIFSIVRNVNTKGLEYCKLMINNLLGKENVAQLPRFLDGLAAVEQTFRADYNAKAVCSYTTTKKEGREYTNMNLSQLEATEAVPLPEGVQAYTPDVAD